MDSPESRTLGMLIFKLKIRITRRILNQNRKYFNLLSLAQVGIKMKNWRSKISLGCPYFKEKVSPDVCLPYLYHAKTVFRMLWRLKNLVRLSLLSSMLTVPHRVDAPQSSCPSPAGSWRSCPPAPASAAPPRSGSSHSGSWTTAGQSGTYRLSLTSYYPPHEHVPHNQR